VMMALDIAHEPSEQGNGHEAAKMLLTGRRLLAFFGRVVPCLARNCTIHSECQPMGLDWDNI
jgi:hypothetical protein